MPNDRMIFALGFARTGTTSLYQAVSLLGLAAFFKQFAMPKKYDRLGDSPGVSFCREMDLRYPGSKFILTVRKMDSWLPSMKWLWGSRHVIGKLSGFKRERLSGQRKALYGTPDFDADLLMAFHRRHVASVVHHFSERSDLLIMDICSGDGWEKLCPFLGVEAPTTPFPNLNGKKEKSPSE